MPEAIDLSKPLTPQFDQIAPLNLEEDPLGTWPKSVHIFELEHIIAIDAAMASGRPLLVRGDPGTGKSQLARAAAELLNRVFISKVIDFQTEVADLWYRYDAVQRLAKAQLMGVIGESVAKNIERDIKRDLAPHHFVIPGPLWWAYAWQDAEKYIARNFIKHDDPSEAESLYEAFETHQNISNERKQNGVVLLLDEIDKAEADLANSLLETLANRAFRVDLLHKIVGKSHPDAPKPLVVITSNDERLLPPAFLRRCLVLHLKLPKTKAEFCAFLAKRGRQHHPDSHLLSDSVLAHVAEELHYQRVEIRQKSDKTPLPGQAEYLDMLNVLSINAKGDEAQLTILRQTSPYIFKKYSR